MFKSIKFVLQENFNNVYRIYCIAKYELLSDMRDSRLGVFWNFANPAIQIITYYFVFGIVLERKSVDHIPFIQWMLCGMVVWFGKELFNHFCLMILLIIFLLTQGVMPSLYWLELFYYLFAAICLTVSLAMITSVLNMLARDTRKLILACMRLLLYLTPILWPISRLNKDWMLPIRYMMKANPIYYIVCGYRDCFLYHHGIMYYGKQMLFFWVFVIVVFAIGSTLMYKFKHKFIDLI